MRASRWSTEEAVRVRLHRARRVLKENLSELIDASPDAFRFDGARCDRIDVFQWVRVAMPGDDPASLTDDEYLAIMAFDLTANGVSLPRPLDSELAAAIVLHTEP